MNKIIESWFVEPELPIGGFQSSFENAESIVFGIQYDETASFRKGCGEAPDQIRAFANNLEPINIFTKRDIAESMVCDLGNLTFTDRKDLFNKVNQILENSKGRFPLILGGEHTITAAVTKQFKNHLFLMFDAHGDLRNSYDNNQWSHACVARRIVEEIGEGSMIQFGIRAITKEEFDYAKIMNISQYFGHEWNSKSEQQFLQEVEDRADSFDGIYLTLDMDGFDPAFVPGVGNPEPLGLTTREVFSLLSKLPRLDGCDITELNPLYDHSGASQSVAARLALFLLTR